MASGDPLQSSIDWGNVLSGKWFWQKDNAAFDMGYEAAKELYGRATLHELQEQLAAHTNAADVFGDEAAVERGGASAKVGSALINIGYGVVGSAGLVVMGGVNSAVNLAVIGATEGVWPALTRIPAYFGLVDKQDIQFDRAFKSSGEAFMQYLGQAANVWQQHIGNGVTSLNDGRIDLKDSSNLYLSEEYAKGAERWLQEKINLLTPRNVAANYDVITDTFTLDAVTGANDIASQTGKSVNVQGDLDPPFDYTAVPSLEPADPNAIPAPAAGSGTTVPQSIER